MSTHHMEEEQLEDIKRFWRTYGKHIIVVIVAIALALTTWLYYKKRENTYYESAALEYHKLLELMEQTDGQSPDELKKIADKATLLKNQYPKTPYAAGGAMLMAKQAVAANALDEAQAQLEWVVLNSKEYDFKQLAYLRIARILLEKKNYEAALKTLEKQEGSRYESAFQEVRGDILVAMQKNSEARAAYAAALKIMPNTSEKMLVQMKYDDLASPQDMLWTPESTQDAT